MQIWVLGSGSGGNAVLIQSGDCRFLIDAGFTPRVMNQRLRAIDVPPDSIQSVIVTHEHFDHAKGVAACARRWNWSVIATGGTRMMCSEWTELPIQIVERKSRFALGLFEVQTLPVSTY